MPVFDQLGDPVCPDCLCEHHEAAYAEFETLENPGSTNVRHSVIADGGTIVQVQITTTETCCVVVNAAIISHYTAIPTNFTIERPLATDRTSQSDSIETLDLKLMHHAAWEVLPAGVYTYFLVNRGGATKNVYAAWIKAVASDCLG